MTIARPSPFPDDLVEKNGLVSCNRTLGGMGSPPLRMLKQTCVEDGDESEISTVSPMVTASQALLMRLISTCLSLAESPSIEISVAGTTTFKSCDFIEGCSARDATVSVSS